MQSRSLLTLLCLCIMLSLIHTENIIPLTDPYCPRHAGSTTSSYFLETPQQTTDSVCGADYTCCTSDYLGTIGEKGDALSTDLLTILDASSINETCQRYLDAFACSQCSRDSFIWTHHATSDAFRVDVCSNWCDEFFNACHDAVDIASGQKINEKYSDSVGMCFGTIGSISNLFLTVFDEGERGCFDSELPLCTENDIGYYYTECNSGSRQLIYYWHPESVCAGGVKLPSSVSGLSCPIECQQGTYLPLGQTECQDCSAGSFSKGGARRVHDWSTFPRTDNLGLSFETYCTDSYGNLLPTDDCSGWRSENNFIESNITGRNNIISVVRTDVSLVESGYVEFEYKVDCEYSFDRLVLTIDETEYWIENTVQSESVRFNLTAGFHTLKWKFKKDWSLSRGEDRAILWWIEVSGLHFHSDFCYDCPAGTYSNAKSSECTKCPANSISNEASSSCVPCGDDEYSFPGDSVCLPRLPCTENDIEISYTECTEEHMRTKTYAWAEPRICNPSAAGSVSLPGSEIVECEDCNPGQYRDGDNCYYCPPGQWSSVGTENECQSCEAGTYAPPVLNIHRWFEWPDFMTTSCSGDCGTSGWRLRGEYADSGTDHANNAEPVLQVEVDIIDHVKNKVEYSVEMECDTYFCYLQVYLDRNLMGIHTERSTAINTYSFDVEPGHHTIQFAFVKYSGRSEEKAILHNLTIWGSSVGGAHQCDDCTAGTAAALESTYCEICPPGTYSGEKASECSLCPENTFSDQNKTKECIPCGHNTFTPEGSTVCSINNCQFDDGKYLYDLNPLSRDDVMWGPVLDEGEHSYYINPCSTSHSNVSCFDDEGNPLKTFACQHVGAWGHATDLGHVMGYYPYSDETGYGVILEFTQGTPGCGNEFLDQPDIPRSANVSVICDPEAGAGVFEGEYPIYRGTVYPHLCNYELQLRSIYGCPVCTDSHYHEIYEECVDGVQQITYQWNTNPKNCHSGISLPENQLVNCSNDILCQKGEKVDVNQQICVPCEEGTFSIGNGFVYEKFEQLAPFTTTCTGEECENFFVSGGNLISGRSGVSILEIEQNFKLKESSYIAFEYKFNGAPGSLFSFSVDDKLIFSETQRTHEYIPFKKDLGIGTHSFSWSFTQSGKTSLTERDSYVSIRKVSLEGLFGSLPMCYECPDGLSPNEDKSTCVECGVNTYSTGVSCEACPEGTYRLPGQNSCLEKPACDKDIHFDAIYSACTDGKSTKEYLPLSPVICQGSTPGPEQVDCPPCPLGTHVHNGECKTCADHGSGYYDEDLDSCVSSPAGTQYNYIKYYDLNALSQLPTDFSTVCHGFCATNGWLMHNGKLGSGAHFGEADSLLMLNVEIASTLVGETGIKFSTSTSLSQKRAITDGLELFIDGTPVEFPYSVPSSETEFFLALSAGSHVITWAFHTEGNLNSQAYISGIEVLGSTSGEATDPMKCPAGSYNPDKDGSCKLCPVGTFSSEEGAIGCSKCPGNTVSRSGATVCSECGTSSYPSRDNSECITDCIFTNGENKFDLSPLDSRVVVADPDSSSMEYSVGICKKLSSRVCDKNANCNTHKNYIVGVSGNSFETYYGYGSLLNFIPDASADFTGKNKTLHAFDLEFVNGDKIPEDCESTSSVIQFYCDLSAGLGYPRLVETGDCFVKLKWTTSHACRICAEEDIALEWTECREGKKYPMTEVINTCYPQDIEITETDQECEMPLDPTTAIVVGVSIGCLFVIVLIFAIVNYCQKKRMEVEYVALTEKYEFENETL
eukprot:TRINITY_DN1589_c0_g1_i1.p1 TRINITY_DN1589_c0_g1~~TRINITY_DN1589_c0_g1_i1.p1  ORF type:complete len:1762 (-),score=366.97 TRINITY_DN1589_c0_g1_i1:36-5285(-)